MKKLFWVGGLVVILLCLAFFNRPSNEFSAINEIKIEFTETTEKTRVMTKNEYIVQIQRLLNESDYENVMYEIASMEDYVLTLTYDNGENEKIRVWSNFGGYTLIMREGKNAVYKLKNEESRNELIAMIQSDK